MTRPLVFLEPGHFHAALTLGERHPQLSDEVIVYGPEGPELSDFTRLVESFNRRAERPTRWRVVRRVGERSLERLLEERPGDAVVLAGRNDRKIKLIRELHDADFHVLADKPWMTMPAALTDVRHVLAGGAVVRELMTGPHEITSRIAERLVRERDIFGEFDTARGVVAIRLASVHHLEKRVSGVPLRRPPWYFDIRAQGDGLADTPTHLVDQALRLVASGAGLPPLTLLAARRWPTPVPRALFRRITGLADFPPELRDYVERDVLVYQANAEIAFRLGDVTAEIATRWDPSEPSGGGDTHTATMTGTAAVVSIEQGAHTDWSRRVFVKPRRPDDGTATLGAALTRAMSVWSDVPGLVICPMAGGFEIEIPAALRSGHESHFPLVLDEFLNTIERGTWPDERAARTLLKYELLGRALTAVYG